MIVTHQSPGRIPPSWRTCGGKSVKMEQVWSSRTTGTGWEPTPTALLGKSSSTGCWGMVPSPTGIQLLEKWFIYTLCKHWLVSSLQASVFLFPLLRQMMMFVFCRAQAIAIGQALVDGRWLDCVTHHDQLFRDEYALYRPLQVAALPRQRTCSLTKMMGWVFC